MDEVERVARALARADRIEICSGATYSQSSYRDPALAAIAALDLPARDARIRADALDEAVRVVAGFNDDSILLCRIGAAILALKEQTNG